MNNACSTSRRISLVDNEPDNTSAFSMSLEDAGFKVDEYNDSLVALSNFTSGSYDLLILDINMPNMNGFELYKDLRKVDEKVRVCFLTASEIYHESLRVPPKTLADVECFIPKPIAIDDFVKRIKEELSP
ncbi:MAG: response regulator [Candidatus Nitrosopolaris sp.]